MNLEHKIDEIINEYNLACEEDGDGFRVKDIRSWVFSKTNYHTGPTEARILILIQQESLEQCLTSPSKFIRDYKVWSMK